MSECPACGGNCIPLCGDEICRSKSDRAPAQIAAYQKRVRELAEQRKEAMGR